MLNIPRTKNEEPIHVPSINAAVAALRVVHDRGEGGGRVFHSAKTGKPFENERDWSDKVLTEAEIRTFRWHDLRHTFTSRLGMKGAVFEIVDLLEHGMLISVRTTCMRWYRYWRCVVPVKTVPRQPRKLLQYREFRGVAQR